MPQVREIPRLQTCERDKQLVAGLQRGEPNAPAALYDRFSPLVNRMVWRLLGADLDHHDLVNDVFVQALRSVSRIREAEQLSSWMLSITGHVVRNEMRRRAIRRRLRVQRNERVDGPAQMGNPEARVRLARVYEILDRMPAGQRIAFISRHVEERSLRETAELCGCSLATVKRWLAKAERRFAELVAEEPLLADMLAGSRWEMS